MHVLTASAHAWPLDPAARCSLAVAPKVASGSRCNLVRFDPSHSPFPYLQAIARPFTPAQRLHNKSDFDRVYRDAKRSADALFAVFARLNAEATPRLGLSIAARAVGNAVRRNRIKRLIRESFRQHQHDLPKADIVVNARAGARNADNASIVQSLERHWRNVSKQCASS